MGTWQLDPYHTQVEFAAKHLGMMTARGHFAEVSSVADIDPDHLEASSVEVTIQAASIRTHNETRDDDLRSSNFLEADKFPTMTFKSTSVVPAGTDRYTLTGDLTIKGTTRPVALQVLKYGEFNDPMMGHRIRLRDRNNAWITRGERCSTRPGASRSTGRACAYAAPSARTRPSTSQSASSILPVAPRSR